MIEQLSIEYYKTGSDKAPFLEWYRTSTILAGQRQLSWPVLV